MSYEALEEYNKKQQEHINRLRRESEKYALIPISEALGLKKKQLERLKYEPGQVCGLCISAIKSLQQENADLKKTCEAMRKTEGQNAQKLFGFVQALAARGGKE